MSRPGGRCFNDQHSVILSNDFDTILEDFLYYVEGHSKPSEKNEWMNSNTVEQWEEVCRVYEKHGLVSSKKDLIGDQRQEKLLEDIDPNDAVVIHPGKLDIASVVSRADRPAKRDKKKAKHRKTRQASCDSQDKEPDSPFVLEQYIGPKNRSILVIKKNSSSEEGSCTEDNLQMKRLKSEMPEPSNGSQAKPRSKAVASGIAAGTKPNFIKSKDQANIVSKYRKIVPKLEPKPQVESREKESKDDKSGTKETCLAKKRRIAPPPSKRKGKILSCLEVPPDGGSCVSSSFPTVRPPGIETLPDNSVPAEDIVSQSNFYYGTDCVLEDVAQDLSAYQMNSYLVDSGYQHFPQVDIDSASFSVSLLPPPSQLPKEHQHFQRDVEYHKMMPEKVPVVILHKIPK